MAQVPFLLPGRKGVAAVTGNPAVACKNELAPRTDGCSLLINRWGKGGGEHHSAELLCYPKRMPRAVFESQSCVRWKWLSWSAKIFPFPKCRYGRKRRLAFNTEIIANDTR